MRKTSLLRHFKLRTEHLPRLARTNVGNVEKQDVSAGLLDDLDWSAAEVAAWCEKRGSFAPFCTKTIILPRQARDKHRETVK
eukprot:COSAG06_NODE_13591_length_1241_cov_1.538529_3_plen_81_part_01